MKHLLFLADLLEQANLGEVGTDIFVGTIPHDVASGMMLRDPLAGHEIDGGLRNFFPSGVQLIVRDPDPETGYARALQASSVLTIHNVSNGDVHITWLTPQTLPVQYPRGDADDQETSVKFHIGFGLKT